MNISNPFTVEDVKRSDQVQITSKMAATATFRGLCVIDEYYRNYINPILEKFNEQNELQQAINLLTLRLSSCLRSISSMNSVAHFNGIAAVTRVVFELWLDIRAIDRSVYTDTEKKFWVFVKADRLRIARKTVKYDEANPGILESSASIQKQYIASEATKIERDARELWGNTEPPHWSGTSDIRQRAAAVDLESQYINHYPLLCAYTHGGASGFSGLDEDTFHSLVFMFHKLAMDTSIDALRILDRHCSINSEIADFEAKIKYLEEVSGLILTDLQLMTLGEPQRLQINLDQFGD